MKKEILMHWKKVVKKHKIEGYTKLSDNERIWYNARTLIDGVKDKGIEGFYSNITENQYKDIMEDLNCIEAEDVVQILTLLNKYITIGESITPLTEDEEEIIDDLEDELFDLEEELETKLEIVIAKVIS